jgi:hypothetical protein
MWGRPVDAEEVRQESAFLGDESARDGDEEATTPQNQTLAEDMDEEHTHRTHSVKRPDTPPPFVYDWETEHVTSSRSHMAPAQTEVVERGIPERVGVEGPEISPHEEFGIARKPISK